MPGRLHAWLERGWYDGGAAGALLAPLGWLFGGVVALRRLAYRRGWFRAERVPCPVIVIGNVTVGGTGKTPLTVWLARALQARGLRVGIVSRGYGGTALEPVRVGQDSNPAVVGDEPVLLAARTAAPVVVARDRVAGARLLAAEVDVLLADDGLQHYRLARDLELVVVDGRRGFGNGRLLPAGPLREPASRARSAAACIVNGGGEGGGRPDGRGLPAGPPVLRMRLAPGEVVALAGGVRAPLQAWRGRRVHGVAGIGDPSRFFATLAAAGLEVVPHPFPDHARYAAADLQFDDELPVLMTEKDAVKCRAFAGPRHHYLEVAAEFDPADAARLAELALGVLHRPRP
jgi:tetraacyldisaccharide 4'-kinase